MSPFRVVSLVAVLVAAPAFGQAGKHPIDAKNAEVMKKLGETYKDAKSLHCQASLETTLTDDDGKSRKVDMRATIDLAKPKLFKLRSDDVKKKAAGLDVACDGEKYWRYDRARKEYVEKDAPKKLERIGMDLVD